MEESPVSGGPGRPPSWAAGARRLYHVAREDDWSRARAASRYEGGARCRADGFIHFSTLEQLAGTLGRFFAGADGLILLTVDRAALGAGLKWEPGPDGALYPHYYGALAVERLSSLGPIARDEKGGHVIPLRPAGAEQPEGGCL